MPVLAPGGDPVRRLGTVILHSRPEKAPPDDVAGGDPADASRMVPFAEAVARGILVEPELPGGEQRQRAVSAGLQRLLVEVGADVLSLTVVSGPLHGMANQVIE